METKRPFAALLLVLVAVLPALPTGSAGVFVDNVISSDTPRNVVVDRSDGVHNVITWDPPSDTDGRTIVGYYLHRYPSNAFYSPIQAFYVGGAGTTSYSDAFGYDHDTMYFLSVQFEDSTGQRTDSLRVGPFYVMASATCSVTLDGNDDDPTNWSASAQTSCL